MIMEATARQTIMQNTIYKQKKGLPQSANDRRKLLFQAVSASLPTGNSARTAYLHCIKDGKNIEPAMGSAAFLNEAINQLAEAYLNKKQKELGKLISHESRANELQKVKMYIADRNVYGIDLNPIAVELAEVSLWLNTIYKGGFVPWFGTQLVCGNSLIGARRQCYRIEQLQTASSGIRWYDNAPERVPVDGKRRPRKQVYHFLTGDPGMANYTDRVIKSLAPDEIKAIKDWNKKFTKPFDADDIQNLLRLSGIIDELWEKQIMLRKEVVEKTSDALSVYGQDTETKSSHTTIREKDMIYKTLYKSEEQRNAGPYARLKFAMDYWCSLWFWPIDKADLLPARSEFIAEMYLILEGTIDTLKGVRESVKMGQLSLFPTEHEQLVLDINELYSGMGIVDIPKLCKQQPRLALVKEIAEKQRFMHWELEFADVFAEHGGFDLILGNPPWIKIEWQEQFIISEKQPLFAIRKDFTATQVADMRLFTLKNKGFQTAYYREYEGITGIQNFCNARENYPDLLGSSINLYTCFLPQAWQFNSARGYTTFIHQENVYSDVDKSLIRMKLYPRLRRHYQFVNQKKLFDIGNTRQFSLNVYGSPQKSIGFDTIANLFVPSTIDTCYQSDNCDTNVGLKDENGDWNVKGNSSRIVHVTPENLRTFAKVFDNSDDWRTARLPALHISAFSDTLTCFADAKKTFGDLGDNLFATGLWNETAGEKHKWFVYKPSHPELPNNAILSSPMIGCANPVYQCADTVCLTHRAFSSVDLTYITESFVQRCKYVPNGTHEEHMKLFPITPWGSNYSNEYRIACRRRLDNEGANTLITTILPPGVAHVDTIFGIAINSKSFSVIAASMMSIVFDFFVRTLRKSDFLMNTSVTLPLIDDCIQGEQLAIRALLLSCVTKWY